MANSSNMTENYITFHDTKIFYKTIGTGSPVILIHGFAEDSSIWENQVELLKDKHLLILPDLPGSGRSALVNSDNVGIDDYAELIRQILLAEKIDQCIMIGHSMGGYITLAFAEKYPKSLIAFGLFHSSAYADDEAKVETRKKAIEFIKKNGSHAFLKTSIPGLFYDQGNSKPVDTLIEKELLVRPFEMARRVDELLEKGKSFSPEALIQYYQAMIARPDRTRILRETTLPVLFIIGEHDKAVPFQHSLEQSHLPHSSYIQVLRNSAHMGMQEEPGRSNEILANFLLNK